ncbi:MAG: hypothetical protein JO180_10735 [Gemmatirosa sp.]|nr:hypothetical protein [Gemmatirosa sp.]
MFEQLRASLRAVLEGPSSPTDRRAALTGLKESLVHARLGVEDLRAGVEKARARVTEATQELETIRRRKAMAAQIRDAETVSVAERFEGLQAERVDVLARKLDAQEHELALAEREVAEMSADFRRAMAGGGAAPAAASAVGTGDAHDRAAAAEVDAMLGADEALGADLDAQRRSDARARRDADADARLAELKRRMGK